MKYIHTGASDSNKQDEFGPFISGRKDIDSSSAVLDSSVPHTNCKHLPSHNHVEINGHTEYLVFFTVKATFYFPGLFCFRVKYKWQEQVRRSPALGKTDELDQLPGSLLQEERNEPVSL